MQLIARIERLRASGHLHHGQCFAVSGGAQTQGASRETVFGTILEEVVADQSGRLRDLGNALQPVDRRVSHSQRMPSQIREAAPAVLHRGIDGGQRRERWRQEIRQAVQHSVVAYSQGRPVFTGGRLQRGSPLRPGGLQQHENLLDPESLRPCSRARGSHP